MDDRTQPVIHPDTSQDIASELAPIHGALSAIMSAIIDMTQAMRNLTDKLGGDRDSSVNTTHTEPVIDNSLLAGLVNPTTGRYTGVYQIGHRYQARVSGVPIGTFPTAEEAALARHETLKESGKLPAKQAPSSPSPDRVKSERERRKTLLAVEQARRASKLDELKAKEESRLREIEMKERLKEEAKIKEIQAREEARLAQIYERERLKDEAKIKEIERKESLKRDAELDKIKARGDERTAQIIQKEELVLKRKRKLEEDDDAIRYAIAAGWFPGKKDGPGTPADQPVKTAEQIAKEMSDWGDDLD